MDQSTINEAVAMATRAALAGNPVARIEVHEIPMATADSSSNEVLVIIPWEGGNPGEIVPWER